MSKLLGEKPPKPIMCVKCGKLHKPHRVSDKWAWQWNAYGHALVREKCKRCKGWGVEP